MGHGRWAKALRFTVTFLAVLWLLAYTAPKACWLPGGTSSQHSSLFWLIRAGRLVTAPFYVYYTATGRFVKYGTGRLFVGFLLAEEPGRGPWAPAGGIDKKRHGWYDECRKDAVT